MALINKDGKIIMAQNGESNAAILYWSQDNSPVTKFAAEEMRDYIGRISGVSLPIRSVESAGEAPWYFSSALMITSLENEEDGLLQKLSWTVDDHLKNKKHDAFSIESTDEEWFPDFEKRAERGKPVFYANNDEAMNTYAENVVKYLKKNPHISIFDAWSPDTSIWHEEDIRQFGSIANGQAYVTNKLKEYMQKELPDVKVENICYPPAIEPPDPEYMYKESTIIDFAPYDRSYEEPIFGTNNETNVYHHDIFKKWRERGFKDEMSIYEYYVKYS